MVRLVEGGSKVSFPKENPHKNVSYEDSLPENHLLSHPRGCFFNCGMCTDFRRTGWQDAGLAVFLLGLCGFGTEWREGRHAV